MRRRNEEEKFIDVRAAMQGSVVFSDSVNLQISGKFEGNLTIKGNLIIGKDADVRADIVGENIIIAGSIKGKIKATLMLRLTSTAQVIADIEAPKISIEKGAIFDGKCKMSQQKLSLSELSEYLSIEEGKIREWVDNGRIPVEQEGEIILFDLKEVETWISRNYKDTLIKGNINLQKRQIATR